MNGRYRKYADDENSDTLRLFVPVEQRRSFKEKEFVIISFEYLRSS
jgi:hypothetical protein